MKRLISIQLLMLIMAVSAFSQADKIDKTIYSFVPQYLINRAIRVDFEKQISGRHFLQLCPQFYLSEKENDNFNHGENQFNNLIGAGLNVYHKMFASSNFKENGLYLSYGPSYHYFNIEYIDNSDDNVITAKADINKIGFDIIIGYQFFIKDIASVDIFTGLGTRLSFMDTDGSDKDRFNTSYFGYNYTGNMMLLGLRIGVIL